MPETDKSRTRSLAVLALAGIVIGGAAAFIQLRSGGQSAPAQPEVPAVMDGGKLQVSHDATELFQRAFWKRPGSGDRILHAERREWLAEEGGVRRWQWFLAVEPEAGLVDDLRQRFDLATGPLVQKEFHAAPPWFRSSLTDSAAVFRAADDSMILVLSADRRILLATGEGHGFALPVAAAR